MKTSLHHRLLCVAAALAGVPAAAAAAASCEARSGPRPATVVELYTSEGCSSCPPADRWLSTLKPRGDVVALAFHVNYWDRLGWADRFASAEATERQRRLQVPSGAKYVYTPQVLVDGRDWRGWPQALPQRTGSAAAPPPALQLSRDGARLVADVAASPGAELAGYWAVLEDGLVSGVRAGENAGSTLRHDHVVRLYRPVPAWAAAKPHRLELTLPDGAAAAGQRVVFVLTDAVGQRPLQALALGC